MVVVKDLGFESPLLRKKYSIIHIMDMEIKEDASLKVLSLAPPGYNKIAVMLVTALGVIINFWIL